MVASVDGEPGPDVRCRPRGTGVPVTPLAPTYENAPGRPLSVWSCSSGLMAMRSGNPVAASLLGAAMRYSAPKPVTRASAPGLIGRVPPSFLSSTAPSSAIRSATAPSPVLVPRSRDGVAPLAGPSGSVALPLRSPATPPGLVHVAARGVSSQPSRP